MRRLLILLLLCYLLECAISRPAESENQGDDSELQEADYERSDEAAAEDAQREEEEAQLDDQFSEYSDRRTEAGGEDSVAGDQPNNRIRQFDRFAGNNNGNEQLVQNSEGSPDGFDENRAHNAMIRNDAVNRRRNGARLDDNGDLLFESGSNQREQLNKVKKNEPNDDIGEPNGQTHMNKKYYSSLQSENRQLEDNRNYENKQEYFNRDRRDASIAGFDDTVTMESKEKKDLREAAAEDDQAAIKRHIKKLSSSELEELLNSLSEDKKALLRKIIDNNPGDAPDYLSKREITKKARAAEDNNFLGGSQLDTSKVSSPNLSTDTTLSQNSGTEPEATKTTSNPVELGDLSTSKNVETSLNIISLYKDLSNNKDETVQDKQEINNSVVADSVSAQSAATKNENKREVNFNDLKNELSDNNLESSESQEPNYQSYVCSQDEDLSQLMDDEASLHYDSHNAQKRDALQEDGVELSDSMKNLQDSFPNSNAYDDSGAYSGDLAPLIRVKRTNSQHAVKKRAAAILPQSKVAYVPYRAENEDEDNDEGNEFYDDGFFDRTASFAKTNVNKLSDTRRKLVRSHSEGALTNAPKQTNIAKDVESGIGSDTDSVLSGVEGVDENLMFNGGARKKRESDKGSKLDLAVDLIKNDLLTCPQTSTSGNDMKKSQSFTNGANYDGNDAFGALPRSYDGELGRYKRIRRLKQPVTTKG